MLGIVIIIIIIVILLMLRNRENLKDPRSFYELTDGEKIQYIIDTYFMGSEELRQTSGNTKKENDYIRSLPVSDQCSDSYDECSKWAANGECTINPGFMLYKCAKSCKSCALNDQQKYNLVEIYGNRDAPHCVYHPGSKGYPDPQYYVRQFDSYYNENIII
jgi:hypothetical protein